MSPSGDSSSRIVHDFTNKVVQKLKLSINYSYKKCAPKQLCFIEKKIRQIRMIFEIENSLFDELSPDGDTKFGNFI